MKQPSREPESQFDTIRRQLDRRRSMPLFILFTAALLLGSSSQSGLPSTPVDWAYLVTLSTALSFMVWSLVRSYRESDELQQLIQLKAAAVSFIVTILALFTGSMLDMVGISYGVAVLQNVFIGSILFWYVILSWMTAKSRR